jgi:hypothetical protein
MNRFRLSLIALCLLLLAGVATVYAGGHSDLARIRAATARFHRSEAAISAGWDTVVPHCVENPGVGGMGYHYVNEALMDLEIEPTRPEVLVYAPAPNGKHRLVAVEYMIPAEPWDALHDSPPTALGHTMHMNPELGAYALHAWVWLHNPDGMFKDWNPNVSCP